MSAKRSMSTTEMRNSSIRKRIINTTLVSPAQFNINFNNPERIQYQPAKMNQSRMSSHSVSERNTKFKLQSLEETLKQLKDDVTISRNQCRQSVDLIAHLKHDMIYNQLFKQKEDLDGKIKGLARHIRAVKAGNQARVNQIYNDCAELWQSTELLRSSLFQISMRIEKLESSMGFNQGYRNGSYKN